MTARRMRSTSVSVSAPTTGSKMSVAVSKAVDISSNIDMGGGRRRRGKR